MMDQHVINFAKHVINFVDENRNKSESSETVSISKSIEWNVLSNKKLRKYQENFIKYIFTFCIVNGREHPLWANWKDKLTNKNMKSAKLKRYLETKCKEFTNKS